MDELDRRLIIELLDNTRQSNNALSIKLGVSEKTVRRRIGQMTESGTITWTIIPDPAKLGYSVRVFVALEIELSSIDTIIQSLNECPNIDFIALCTGQMDILLGAWFSTSDEMTDFVKNYLGRIPGIRRSQTSVALEVKAKKTANIVFLKKATN